VRNKSVIAEARQIDLAAELIRLGARLAMLEAETSLSRERLLKLYKEIVGKSPPKGMLPYSTDWFTCWRPNIHASLFIDVYQYLRKHAGVDGIEAVIKAYKLYLEHIRIHDMECVLSLTRAWSLMRFIDAKILTTIPCTECRGQFIVHKLDLHNTYVCGMCNMPSRAGQTNKARAEREEREGKPGADAIVPVHPHRAVVAQASAIPRRRTRLRHAIA
jgi:flagellar transcriptional activator FlhC